jgi:hypothetical protein
MNKKLFFLLIFAIILILSSNVLADDEASNRAYVKSSEYGTSFAKCIPDESYGPKGKTLVYSINPKDGSEQLIATYDWFSKQIYLMDYRGLVRLGPWQRGRKASANHLAIAFYKDGKLLKEYSTLDIAGKENNVSSSVSHYTVFEKIIGFRWLGADDYAFDVQTNDNRTLSFNISTGNLFTQEEENTLKILDKILQLKSSWSVRQDFINNHDPEKMKATMSHSLTVEELKNFAPDEFPEIPTGYKLIPGSFFEPARLEK